VPYVFLSPFFVLFALFFVYPVIYSIILSFQRWSANSVEWVGLDNYRFVVDQPAVRRAFVNLVWYGVVNNVVQISVALALAVLLDQQVLRRVAGALRVVYFLPNVVSGVTTALLFGIILGAGGVADHLLSSVDLHVSWLQSTQWARPAVVAAGAWRWIGYWVVILTAGLQAIPREYYEAAAVDGAGWWKRVRHVSLPSLRPILLFVIVVNTIGTMQIFEEPFLLFETPGGPLSAATTPVLEMYRLGFENFDLGGAAAIGWLLAIVIVVLTLGQMVLARRREWIE